MIPDDRLRMAIGKTRLSRGFSGAEIPRRVSVTGREARLHPPDRRKDLIFVLESKPEGEKNLSLGIHSAVHSLLDAMNRPKSNFCLTSKLGLGHQSVFSQLTDPILSNRPSLTAFHTVVLPQSPSPAMLFCIGVNLDAVSSEFGNSLEEMRSWRVSALASCTPAFAAATDRCGALAHTKGMFVNHNLGSLTRALVRINSSFLVVHSLRSTTPAEAWC
jgi:hypothetical protein